MRPIDSEVIRCNLFLNLEVSNYNIKHNLHIGFFTRLDYDLFNIFVRVPPLVRLIGKHPLLFSSEKQF